MKGLVEYISEHTEQEEVVNQITENEEVWVVKDKDLDGAIMDVCPTEDDANKALEEHMKENADYHLEVEKCNRSEVEKKED